MKAVTAILLAAGEGKRMVSKRQKVMHSVCGRPIIGYVMRSVQKHIAERPITVIGYDGDSVKEYFGKDSAYAYQEHTGSVAEALRAGMSLVYASKGYVLVDAASGNAASRLICFSDDAETRIAAAYCFEVNTLRRCQQDPEGDIEDYIMGLREAGLPVIDVYAPEIEGIPVETREDLWCCTEIMQRIINTKHMEAGVTFVDPNSAYIDADVKIGMDTVIYPDVYLLGSTTVREDCVIYNGCRLENTSVGNGCTMQAVVAIDARVDDGARIGPFVRLRPNTHIGANCKVGNFVEVKNSTVGEKTSIAHLTYVGDADVGSHVNMGCGTVFVNYDGFDKHRTTVGNNVFLGCQTALVAPVKVGDDAYTAAGSVITDDVEAGALAIARSKQINKPGWVGKYRALKKR